MVDPNLPLKGSTRLGSRKSFVAFIRAPTMPDGSAGSMPPFGEEADQRQQAADLYLYVSNKNRW